MGVELLRFNGGRKLFLCSLNFDLSFIKCQLSRGFSAMLPAFDCREREISRIISIDLLDAGCLEFCCLGEEAENLHDELDEIIEIKGLSSIITTWHDDIQDACEYFVNASGGGADCLVGLMEEHGLVVSELRREVREMGLE